MGADSVIICGLEDALRNLPELVSKAGFKLEKSRLALVKPNICGIYHPSLNLLSSVIEFLLSKVESVVIGETRSMIHNPREQFRRLGVNEVLKRFGGRVKAVDLSADEWVKVKVPKPHVLRELELSRMVLNSDVLVNLPKVGTHSTTRLTCALKNLFGLLPQGRKYSLYHPLGMDRVIADVAQVVKPDLNVVDAGRKVIIGVDPLTVDIVACRFVNLDPSRVGHIRLISEDLGWNLETLLKTIRIVKV
ncbi:MAG: DUF362 domain-containing protein [Candidatus Bathyarchaeia archaeon]